MARFQRSVSCSDRLWPIFPDPGNIAALSPGRAWHSQLCDSPPAPAGANAGGNSHLLPSCLSGFPWMAPACCWDSRTAGLEVRGLSSPFNPLPQPPQQGQACSTMLGFILLHIVFVRAFSFFKICTNDTPSNMFAPKGGRIAFSFYLFLMVETGSPVAQAGLSSPCSQG